MHLRATILAFVLALAPSVAAAEATQPSPIVIGQSWKIASRTLSATRTINVWTPPSYAKGDRRYPVVYLIDGGLAQDFEHITGLAQLGALSWEWRDVIVVGIETVDRRHELAFPVERDETLKRDYPTAGASDAFRRYVIDEVKPFVERRYRTSGENALMGESLAGLFIVETLLKQPAAFDTYIAIDPSLWWDKGRLTEAASGLLAKNKPMKKRVWLSIGRETSEQPVNAQRFVAAIKALPAGAVELHDEPRPALTHATIYHPTALEAFRTLYPRPAQ